MRINEEPIIGVIGAGTMGNGIAQVAATAGYRVRLFDANQEALAKAQKQRSEFFSRSVSKGKITSNDAEKILSRINDAKRLDELAECSMIIEAIVEDLAVKQSLFSGLEKIVAEDCILASNTSSLSITSIGSGCRIPQRVAGLHFFNPAPLMPLVEIIPGMETSPDTIERSRIFILECGKSGVLAKDTPGFIVNRIARPYYGESIRIFEELWEDIPDGENGMATIDLAMKETGGFKMGPFELMDMIGNDINYTVTETVWKQMFYDARYKPSITQKRLFEAKRFGKKNGRGYYNYSADAIAPVALHDKLKGEKIFLRVISMLINEAADALYYGIASKEDIETAMTKGVNYPKGLFKWCDEIGVKLIAETLDDLRTNYSEDRYRTSVLLKKMAHSGSRFYS